jgi:hypothetical protein
MEIKKQELKPVRPDPQPLLTYEQVNIITSFERLWAQIAVWTRAFFLSSLYNLPDQQEVAKRLYSLPMDFSSIMSSYYGTDSSKKFVNLLTVFLTCCVGLVEGMKKKDQELVDMSTVQWYQCADNIAKFLSSINVYWDENQWRNLLNQYMKMKIDEIVATMNGEYARQIELYQSMEDITFIIGSYMARGILAMSQYQYR